MKRLLMLLLLPLCICFADAPSEEPVEELVQKLLVSMQKRLDMMHDVARYKWNANLPVEDKGREKELLTQLVAKAALYGINNEWAENFLQSQMDAAKLLQEHDIAQWKKEEASLFSNVPDLKTEIRPRLDVVTEEIFHTLAVLGPHLQTPLLTQAVLQQGGAIGRTFPEEVWKKAVTPLAHKPAL
ncbi:MAG: gamma subclass chorismate mutase AroQ [Verrucomicrobia bacterium]|nr:gamma subclass chorismate mutase AroQ [Verrucomicrobiota bacterium]